MKPVDNVTSTSFINHASASKLLPYITGLAENYIQITKAITHLNCDVVKIHPHDKASQKVINTILHDLAHLNDLAQNDLKTVVASLQLILETKPDTMQASTPYPALMDDSSTVLGEEKSSRVIKDMINTADFATNLTEGLSLLTKSFKVLITSSVLMIAKIHFLFH